VIHNPLHCSPTNSIGVTGLAYCYRSAQHCPQGRSHQDQRYAPLAGKKVAIKDPPGTPSGNDSPRARAGNQKGEKKGDLNRRGIDAGSG